MKQGSSGFTLIELLVVIAIIAILSASLMPALSSAMDRSRVVECHAHLAQAGMALRMYFDDYGAFPQTLPQLLAQGHVGDANLLRCTKTGAWYYYRRPTRRTPPEAVVAACCDPATPAGRRPHTYRNRLVVLEKCGALSERQ